MARRLFYLNRVFRHSGWITGGTAVHLRRVLRAQAGAQFDLSDGERFYLGEIAAFGPEEIEFRLLESRPPSPEPLQIHLFASLIKFDHFEWMLEKATELGAARVTPVQAARSEKGLAQGAAKRLDRWVKIVRESGQQCRRLRPPEIAEPVGLKDALAMQADCRLWLEEEPGAPPILLAAPARGAVAVLIGPEGGWEEGERKLAGSSGWTSVSLGSRILRAETAALATRQHLER